MAPMTMSRLFQKTLLLMFVLFGVIATATSILSAWTLDRRLTEEYESKGTAIAKSIADSSVEVLLNRDASTIQAMIDQFLEIEGISYVFVVNGAGDIVSHTFVPSVPEEMRALEHHKRKTRLQDIHVRGMGEFIDVSAPILVGRAGYVHIGMSKDRIRSAIWSAIIGQQSLMLVIFLASIGMAWMVVSRVSRPLNTLARHVKALSTRDFRTPTIIPPDIHALPERSKDEIGDLAASFIRMEENLHDSIERLTATTAAKERIESELKIAHTIQMGILPKIFPPFPEHSEFDIFAVIEPAREVGGDFYDFYLMNDHRLCFGIGDVSGKGVPASLFMAVTKTLLKVSAGKLARPEDVLRDVNVELCRDNDSAMFVTVFYGVLDLRTGELSYSNGGHNPPYLLADGGIVSELESTGGVALGVAPEARYEARTRRLGCGDSLCLYTDGVTEAMDANGGFFSESRLEDELARASGSAADVTQHTVAAVKRFARGAEQSDDITMLVVKFLRAQNEVVGA